MKTKKYSVVMKAVAALAMMFFIAGASFAQTIEEREAGTSNYSVAVGAGGEEYTWTIAADTPPVSVNPAPTSGSGTLADPYVIDWTADLIDIDVQWAADASPDINSTTGQITVQMRTTTGGVTCTSALQTMDLSFWSLPSATIATADQNFCSNDAIGGTITIDLTGAPDAGQSGNDGFEVIYDVAVDDPTLTVSGPNGPTGAGQSVTSDGATVTIPLPDALVNTDVVAHTYTITLQTVQDDFNDGPYAVAAQVYTITVYPIPATGIITSDGALTRR